MENEAWGWIAAWIVRLPEIPEGWLQADSLFFLVGQLAFIHTWEDKGFPLSAAYGTGDVLRGTGLLCSKQAAPRTAGPYSFCPRSQSIVCQLLVWCLVPNATCYSIWYHWWLFPQSRVTHDKPQKVEGFISHDFLTTWWTAFLLSPSRMGIRHYEDGTCFPDKDRGREEGRVKQQIQVLQNTQHFHL